VLSATRSPLHPHESASRHTKNARCHSSLLASDKADHPDRFPGFSPRLARLLHPCWFFWLAL
jgi:hypothetical protein